MIKKLEKYFSQFTDKELEDNFSELVRRYNEKQKSEQRNVESAFFYPIKVGSSVISESNFQDYKNDIIRRLNKGIEIQNIRDFYQKKVIDKFLSDKRLSEIYEKIKVGEPIKNPPFSNIMKKWSFWSNVHRVQDIIELENFLKELPLQQPETDNPDEVKIIDKLKQNKFDDVEPSKVYQHFKQLVDNSYITNENFNLFLSTVFEQNKTLTTKIEIIKPNSKQRVQKIFYSYYEKLVQRKYGTKQKYIDLLCNNFTGFNPETLSTNFAK